jgi:hypothetical protein
MSRIHTKIAELVMDNQRDIALISEPGMGLSTLLQDIELLNNGKNIILRVEDIKFLWEREFKDRNSGCSYVLDNAIILELIKLKFIDISIPTINEVEKMNLPIFLKKHGASLTNNGTFFVIIDRFDKLPYDLALVILNQIKALSDLRATTHTGIFRFIIGGAINFYNYFPTPSSGNSPATNFDKIYPNKFLLTPEESYLVIEDRYRNLIKYPDISHMIVDLSGGYIHYLLELCKWAKEEINEILDSPQALYIRLRTIILEDSKTTLLKYCHSGWSEIKSDDFFIQKFTSLASTGIIYDISHKCDKALYNGLLIQPDPYKREIYKPSNKIVELFIRQKLYELNNILPLDETPLYVLPEINNYAYLLVSEIDNRLRNFMADMLYKEKGEIPWNDNYFTDKYKQLFSQISNRFENEKQNKFSSNDYIDPFLSYFNISELLELIQGEGILKDKENQWIELVDEINYLKQRITYFRPVITSQIDSIKNSWKKFYRSVIFNDISNHNNTSIDLSIVDKKKKSILFLSADPSNLSRIRLGQEFREIDEQLLKSKNRDFLDLENPALSLRPKDISQALLNTNSEIIHFSGHGSSEGTLSFEDDLGKSIEIQPTALANLFKNFSSQVGCVVLNSCYSEYQAQEIAKYINFVIGVNGTISDQAAITFSIGFYQALGAGRTIEEAYELGCAQMGIAGFTSESSFVHLIKR